MKFLTIFILILTAFTISFAQATQKASQPAKELSEADKLAVQTVKLFQQKKYDEALPIAEKAVAAAESSLGKNHISLGNLWRNVAYIQLRREKPKEAEKAFRAALEIYEKNQPLAPADEKIFAELLQTVAVHEAIDGDFGGAEKKFKQFVAVTEKAYGVETEETATALVRLAEFYLAVGEYEKSESPLNRSLEMRAKKYGEKDERTREAYENYSCTLRKLGKTDELATIEKRFESPVDKSKVRTVESGVVNGKALFLAKPPYPQEAKAQRVSGTVKVRVTIDESGTVIRACAIEGPKLLQRASEIAAYKAKFAPTTVEQKPVKVTGVITYNFVANTYIR
jgi:TonB family protein